MNICLLQHWWIDEIKLRKNQLITFQCLKIINLEKKLDNQCLEINNLNKQSDPIRYNSTKINIVKNQIKNFFETQDYYIELITFRNVNWRIRIKSDSRLLKLYLSGDYIKPCSNFFALEYDTSTKVILKTNLYYGKDKILEHNLKLITNRLEWYVDLFFINRIYFLN